jgi:hypothetical protein
VKDLSAAIVRQVWTHNSQVCGDGLGRRIGVIDQLLKKSRARRVSERRSGSAHVHLQAGEVRPQSFCQRVSILQTDWVFVRTCKVKGDILDQQSLLARFDGYDLKGVEPAVVFLY